MTADDARFPAEQARAALGMFGAQRYDEALPLLEQLLEASNTPLPAFWRSPMRGKRPATPQAPPACSGIFTARCPQDDYAVTLVATLMRAAAHGLARARRGCRGRHPHDTCRDAGLNAGQSP